MIRILALLLALALSCGAWGQEEKASVSDLVRETADVPRGAPYNTGAYSAGAVDSSSVPLRDFFSSRLDQFRAEVIDRFAQQRDVIDERDRQYAQRFAAQQEALSAALLAAEKAVANALAAAKEAVIKAENAANDRFDGVNEMRGQLDDQARNFVTKDTFDAKFEALENKLALALEGIAANGRRIDSITSKGEGASNTWALVVGAIVLAITIGGFAMALNRQKAAA